MPPLFPDHPLTITALYLIGLYHKKDSLNEEGKILRAKDLTAACEAFELAGNSYDRLMKNRRISSVEEPYFFLAKCHAGLERAKVHFSIAQLSKGGKKQIYTKYAEKIFIHLIEDLEQRESIEQLTSNYSQKLLKIWAEAEFGLFQVFEEEGKVDEREAILDKMAARFEKLDLKKGYWPAKVFSEKGKLARQSNKQAEALLHYIDAKKASDEKGILSPDERLELSIQQSLCCKELGKLDEAMRLLSQVINEDEISSLRIKAMLLRAEIYELQGRPELALKQLEAASFKGGEWAQQAKMKLQQFPLKKICEPRNGVKEGSPGEGSPERATHLKLGGNYGYE